MTKYCINFPFLLKESMGFEQGRGLGRYGQGRADIIEASQQRGRRGLGFRVEGFDDKDFTWDEEEEVCTDILILVNNVSLINNTSNIKAWEKSDLKIT